jgi:hypothetical protein
MLVVPFCANNVSAKINSEFNNARFVNDEVNNSVLG